MAQPSYAIGWRGAVAALHSLALVNRAICTRLARRGHRLRVLPPRSGDPASAVFGEAAGLLGQTGTTLDDAVECLWRISGRRTSGGRQRRRGS